MAKKIKNKKNLGKKLTNNINPTFSNTYGPNDRGFMEQKEQIIRSGNRNGFTDLPDPVTDDIVANNISQSEFDYTYNGGQDIYDEDEYEDE
ncbi:hypothetical protein [Clostridium sp. DL1XJH146]